jgi:3-oxoacyl-(acyl-carrier-protein) synthase
MNRRAVVTGLGFITSIGNDRSAVTASLRELRGGIARFEFAANSNLPVKVAGTVKDRRSPTPGSPPTPCGMVRPDCIARRPVRRFSCITTLPRCTRPDSNAAIPWAWSCQLPAP